MVSESRDFAATWRSIEPGQQRVLKMLVSAVVLVLVSFSVLGLVLKLLEDLRLSTYRPVKAEVLSIEIESITRLEEEFSSINRIVYRPSITYRYFVNARSYSSDRVTPLNESRSLDWAKRINRDFRIGQIVTAYYDADRPQDSFLIKQRSSVPWVFLIAPLFILAPILIFMERVRRKLS